MAIKKYTPLLLLLAVALFLTLSANARFFAETANMYPAGEGNHLFLLSVGLLLFASQILFLALFSLLLPLRWVLSLFLGLSAMIAYFSDSYGTIIDRAMLLNILQTDFAETRDLFNGVLLFRLAVFGILPIAIVWRVPLPTQSLLRRSIQYAAVASLALMAGLGNVLLFSDKYSGFIRQHKVLRSYTNPLEAISSAVALTSGSLARADDKPIAKILSDAKIEHSDSEKELIILVVGETARADRFALNGYRRDTNPALEKLKDIISYTNIHSCGTSTAISVPCMFSALDKDHFNVDNSRRQENVLDVLTRAGVTVLWRDNNSSSKGVADRVSYEDFRGPAHNSQCDIECRDLGMLDGLQDFIDRQSGDVLIVLHQMGNHGPAYFKRYPAGFEQFKPACHSVELANCSPQEINNAYDNAILYTDYFLSRVIALLQANTPAYETAMLYVGDHGESLGEHGLYLHGAPNFIAPEEQTHVPVILWLGESSDIDRHKAFALKDHINSHDAVFYSLLTAFEIESPELVGGQTFFSMND